jgi:hypothetical protein
MAMAAYKPRVGSPYSAIERVPCLAGALMRYGAGRFPCGKYRSLYGLKMLVLEGR